MKAITTMTEVFQAGGLIYITDGQVKVRNCPAALIDQLREHKTTITEMLRQIYDFAPSIEPELIRLIWLDAFNPAVLGNHDERIAHVLWWAELARDHAETVMRALTEPPVCLGYLTRKAESAR